MGFAVNAGHGVQVRCSPAALGSSCLHLCQTTNRSPPKTQILIMLRGKKICLSALTMCITSTSQFPQYPLSVFILTTPMMQKGLLSLGGQEVVCSNKEEAYRRGRISAHSSQILMRSTVNTSHCTPIDSPVPNATTSTSQEGIQPKFSSSILCLG